MMPELSLGSRFFQLVNSGSMVGLFFQALPVALVVGMIYAVYRCCKIKKPQVRYNLGHEIIRILFVCYLTGLIYLLFVPSSLMIELYRLIIYGWASWQNMNLQFFTFKDFNLVPTIILWLKGEVSIGSWVKSMLVGNLLMFMPLGVFLPLISDKVNNKNIFGIAILVPVVVEVLQPVMGRSFDIDDLIMNFVGILAGYFICYGIKRIAGRKRGGC